MEHMYYAKQMPLGHWCVFDRESEKVVRCFFGPSSEYDAKQYAKDMNSNA